MNVVDMRDFLSHAAATRWRRSGAATPGTGDEPDPGDVPLDTEEVPDAARRLGTYFSRIVEAATASNVRGREVVTTVRCRRRPSRRGCPGRIEVMLTDVPSRLDWWCPSCRDSGLIANWRRTPWDLSIPVGQVPRGEIAWVHMPADVHRALEALEWSDLHLLRIVRGAESDLDDVLVGGPVMLLAQLRDRVAERIPDVPSERGRRLLDQAHFLLDICCAD